MRFPLHVTTDQVSYQIKQSLRGEKRYPLVLMLEPLYTCNLACIGCSIERHTGKLADRLPLETCLAAVDQCGAPTVSLCGGEPTLYPELPALIDAIVERKRHIYLCTNGLLLDTKVFGKIAPRKRLTVNVHLDGMRETHDKVCAREGVFDKAIAMIAEAKRHGYHVTTNTTVFKETSIEEIEELCALVTSLGIDGMLVSPGYHYESVKENIFATRTEINRKFERVLELSKRYKLQSTPMYLEFAAGKRDYDCSPWSTVTYTPKGWKAPCYLIGESYIADWTEFWTKTDWAYWESRQDEKCANCAMHSGFEASAVRELRKSPKDMARMVAWNFLWADANADAEHDAIVLAAMPEELAPLRALLTDAHPVAGGGFGIDIIAGRLGASRVALAVTGDGDRNARVGAAAVLALAPARALLAIGVAGALSADLVPGELVAVTRVLRERGPLLAASPRLADAARDWARAGVAVTADRIADTVDEKRRLLAIAAAPGGNAATAAVVDLESAAYAEAAIAARVPWLILRAVSDTAAEALPSLLNRARDVGGSVRRGRVVAGLLREPSALPRLLGLRRRVTACAEALALGAARVIAAQCAGSPASLTAFAAEART